MKLPKKIYLRWNTEGQEEYLEVTEKDLEMFSHKDKVGIYVLKEIKTLVKKSELVK